MSEEQSPPSPPPSVSTPHSIFRRQSPQTRSQTRSLSFAPVVRRSSAQARIDEILDVGRERADAMHRSESWASGRSPRRFQPLPRSSEEAQDGSDTPNEHTGIFQRGRDYQSTRTNSHASPLSSLSGIASSLASSRPPVADEHAEDAHDHEMEEKQGWKDYLAGLWSIELENKGSVARDHLALERTYLAWLRTSLAFASIGIAITQLFRLNTSLSAVPHLGKSLGATFLGISILVLFLGYQRYFHSQQWVLKGKFPASRGTIVLISLIALLLIIASLAIVIVIQPMGSQPN